MPRMQDTTRRAQSWPPGVGWGLRGWPPWVLGEPGPISHPGCWKERCYFCFSFSAFLTSWGLSKAGLAPFSPQPHGAAPGC